MQMPFGSHAIMDPLAPQPVENPDLNEAALPRDAVEISCPSWQIKSAGGCSLVFATCKFGLPFHKVAFNTFYKNNPRDIICVTVRERGNST